MNTSRLIAFGLVAAFAAGGAHAAGQFRATLAGASEVPANTSTATGNAHAKLDDDGTTLRVHVRYSGLSSGVTGAHVHSGAAGTNGPVVVDLQPVLGKSAGTIAEHRATLDAAAAAQLKAGTLYVNVHTTQFPDGEIRGQLMAHPEDTKATAPEPEEGDGEADSEL